MKETIDVLQKMSLEHDKASLQVLLSCQVRMFFVYL